MLVLGTAAFVMHFDDRPVQRPLAASLVLGFLAGTCITGKLHLVPFALAIGLGWLLISRSWPDAGRRLLGFTGGILFTSVPLFLFRWLETGNPVLPYYNNVFKSPHFRTDGITAFVYSPATFAARLAELFLQIPDHWAPRWLRLPWRLVHDSSPFTEVAAAGVLGLLVPMLIVAVAFGWRGRPGSRVLWGALVLSLVGWWLKFQYLRFHPSSRDPRRRGRAPRARRSRSAASTAPCDSCGHRGGRLAAAAFFVSTAASFWNVPDDKLPLSVAIGRESESSYEHRALLDAAAFEYLNAHAARNARIIGSGYARSLLRGDLDLSPAWEFSDRLIQEGRFTSDPEVLKSQLDAAGFDWVVVGDQYRLLDVEDDYLAVLLQRHGQIVFADHLRDVYRITDMPSHTPAGRAL